MIFRDELAKYQWSGVDVIRNKNVVHPACLFEVIVELHELRKFDQFEC
jgi:hypothetical protein